jgi:hypothetical protein
VLLNWTAQQLGQSWPSKLDLWIPYTKTNSFSSIYTTGKMMNSLLWAPGEPSAGEACVHCTSAGCEDDPCTLEMSVHVCEFPARKPLLQIRGLCEKSNIGM